jgi:hypothetical protein
MWAAAAELREAYGCDRRPLNSLRCGLLAEHSRWPRRAKGTPYCYCPQFLSSQCCTATGRGQKALSRLTKVLGLAICRRKIRGSAGALEAARASALASRDVAETAM